MGTWRMSYKEINTAMTLRSGSVVHEGKLVSFLYELMRDHLPPGKVESIVRNAQLEDSPIYYSNGWLAEYAKDLCNRLEE